jgi:hypothetical protein
MKYVVTEKLSKLASDFDFKQFLIDASVFGEDNDFLQFANGKGGYCVVSCPWGIGLVGITRTVVPTVFYSVTHGTEYDNKKVIFCTFDELAEAQNYDEEEDYNYQEA